MRKYIFGAVIFFATSALAFQFNLKFTDNHQASSAGGYNFYFRRTQTPWANVTPINLFVPPTTTPGIHEQSLVMNISPGPFECAITAYIMGDPESPLSNILNGSESSPTSTATQTQTASLTATVTRTATATRTNTPQPTLAPPTFISF